MSEIQANDPAAPPPRVAIAPRAAPLWPLPLVAALLPALAALTAALMYADPAGSRCNPFVDDCVSISRMARHGLANTLFRVLALPGAVLQLLTWLAASAALAAAGAARRDAWPPAACGACAGAALVVYVGFLGSDGDVYRWLRRWGTLAYFGGTYLALLLYARALGRAEAAGALAGSRAHRRALTALLAFIAAFVVGHTIVVASGAEGLEDRIENLTEWWGASAITLSFVVVAAQWRHWGLRATIGVPPRRD